VVKFWLVSFLAHPFCFSFVFFFDFILSTHIKVVMTRTHHKSPSTPVLFAFVASVALLCFGIAGALSQTVRNVDSSSFIHQLWSSFFHLSIDWSRVPVHQEGDLLLALLTTNLMYFDVLCTFPLVVSQVVDHLTNTLAFFHQNKKVYLTVSYCPTLFTGEGAVVAVDPTSGI